jgi:colanic acid biosynthesis glycosyl transferase WcaI
MQQSHNKVWVISELYYPVETSTGYLLTCTAEGLAEKYDVSVLCRKSFQSADSGYLKSDENHNGVAIHRCWGTEFDKNKIFFRIINIATISLSIFFQALMRVKKNDCILVVTNPPALPFVINVVCRLRSAKCMLIVHDVYPEAMVAAGLTTPQSWLTKFMGWMTTRLYQKSDRIVVLGRDMYSLVARKLPKGDERIRTIENWADLDLVQPLRRTQSNLLSEIGILDKFVVQYAGNMGRTHGLEYLVEVARCFSTTRSDIHFLLIGGGAKKKWIEEVVAAESLSNITLVGNLPRSDQINFLNACDVAIISFVPNMAGVSVPSRTYNTMAAGSPIIAVADEHSELSQVVKEEEIGWVVAPGDIETLQSVILQAADQPETLQVMATRARNAAEEKYSLRIANNKYCQLIEELIDM